MAGRTAALALMQDACIIDRPGAQVLNTTPGKMETPYTLVYDGLVPGAGGKCRVQQVGTQAGSPNAGEHQFVIVGHVVQLPIDATAYAVGDRVRVTVATLDPALVGRTLTVTSLTTKSHATMRRLICEEVIA